MFRFRFASRSSLRCCSKIEEFGRTVGYVNSLIWELNDLTSIHAANSWYLKCEVKMGLCTSLPFTHLLFHTTGGPDMLQTHKKGRWKKVLTRWRSSPEKWILGCTLTNLLALSPQSRCWQMVYFQASNLYSSTKSDCCFWHNRTFQISLLLWIRAYTTKQLFNVAVWFTDASPGQIEGEPYRLSFSSVLFHIFQF